MDKNFSCEFIAECVMRAPENGKENKIVSKYEYTSPPGDLFDQVQILSGLDLMSNSLLERWTDFGDDRGFVSQSACISLVPT